MAGPVVSGQGQQGDGMAARGKGVGQADHDRFRAARLQAGDDHQDLGRCVLHGLVTRAIQARGR